MEDHVKSGQDSHVKLAKETQVKSGNVSVSHVDKSAAETRKLRVSKVDKSAAETHSFKTSKVDKSCAETHKLIVSHVDKKTATDIYMESKITQEKHASKVFKSGTSDSIISNRVKVKDKAYKRNVSLLSDKTGTDNYMESKISKIDKHATGNLNCKVSKSGTSDSVTSKKAKAIDSVSKSKVPLLSDKTGTDIYMESKISKIDKRVMENLNCKVSKSGTSDSITSTKASAKSTIEVSQLSDFDYKLKAETEELAKRRAEATILEKHFGASAIPKFGPKPISCTLVDTMKNKNDKLKIKESSSDSSTSISSLSESSSSSLKRTTSKLEKILSEPSTYRRQCLFKPSASESASSLSADLEPKSVPSATESTEEKIERVREAIRQKKIKRAAMLSAIDLNALKLRNITAKPSEMVSYRRPHRKGTSFPYCKERLCAVKNLLLSTGRPQKPTSYAFNKVRLNETRSNLLRLNASTTKILAGPNDTVTSKTVKVNEKGNTDWNKNFQSLDASTKKIVTGINIEKKVMDSDNTPNQNKKAKNKNNKGTEISNVSEPIVTVSSSKDAKIKRKKSSKKAKTTDCEISANLNQRSDSKKEVLNEKNHSNGDTETKPKRKRDRNLKRDILQIACQDLNFPEEPPAKKIKTDQNTNKQPSTGYSEEPTNKKIKKDHNTNEQPSSGYLVTAVNMPTSSMPINYPLPFTMPPDNLNSIPNPLDTKVVSNSSAHSNVPHSNEIDEEILNAISNAQSNELDAEVLKAINGPNFEASMQQSLTNQIDTEYSGINNTFTSYSEETLSTLQQNATNVTDSQYNGMNSYLSEFIDVLENSHSSNTENGALLPDDISSKFKDTLQQGTTNEIGTEYNEINTYLPEFVDVLNNTNSSTETEAILSSNETLNLGHNDISPTFEDTLQQGTTNEIDTEYNGISTYLPEFVDVLNDTNSSTENEAILPTNETMNPGNDATLPIIETPNFGDDILLDTDIFTHAKLPTLQITNFEDDNALNAGISDIGADTNGLDVPTDIDLQGNLVVLNQSDVESVVDDQTLPILVF